MPIYMSIPGVYGEVTDPNYLYWIELSSLQWGGMGTSSTNSFIVTKQFDSSSSTLYYKCVIGANLGQVVIALLKRDGGNGQEYMRYSLSDTMIASYVTSGSNPVAETVGLNFTKVEMKNSAMGDDTCSPPGSPSSYNLTPSP
jgi:type VI protein secretion system component Hcp